MEDIEKEFDMDKEWMGGLIQTAITVFYIIGAPVFGYFGDRYSRKWLIILSIVMWSTSTMVSTFMTVIHKIGLVSKLKFLIYVTTKILLQLRGDEKKLFFNISSLTGLF